jgi:hypothetical protein
MRQITQTTAKALINHKAIKLSNTQVVTYDNVSKMYLHGNLIAVNDNGTISVSNAGWFSKTTKERLNGIQGVNIKQSKGLWYLNGAEWNGKLIKI